MNQSLSKFQALNSSISIVSETEHYNIESLWDDDTFMCRFEKKTDFEPIEHIFLPKELAALYNTKEESLEFIYAPVDKDNRVINRSFTFYYDGEIYNAKFSEPSKAIVLFATNFRDEKMASETDYRNLKRFRDYYQQDQLPKFLASYYKDTIPITFKIEGNFKKFNNDFIAFSKNLNFYLTFHDRLSPFILIYEKDEHKKFNKPCFSDTASFPETLNVRKIDSTLVDLFEVARRTTNTRLKFLFYFQVLEYCSYYHLNDEFKRRLTNIIKRPDLLSNSTYYGKLITEEFKDHFKQNDDSSKLERLFTDFINLEDIRLEIAVNHEYFTKDVVFDGGLIIPPLINDVKDLDAPHKDFIKKVKTNIEKIRNVLVHIRESRENKVILPTIRNTHLLVPYLYLTQRIAEHVAIQYE